MPLYRVTNRITSPHAGGESMNVVHVRTLGTDVIPSGDNDLEEALDAMHTTYDAHKGIYAPGSSIEVGYSVIADPYGTPQYYAYTPVPIAGPGEGAIAPPHLALVVGLRTTSATRAGRGRVFLGPLNALALDGADGTPMATYVASARDAWAAFIADSSTANGWALAVWSGVDQVARDVVSSAVRDSLAVMRSRRP